MTGVRGVLHISGMDVEILMQIAYALGIGILIGLERAMSPLKHRDSTASSPARSDETDTMAAGCKADGAEPEVSSPSDTSDRGRKGLFGTPGVPAAVAEKVNADDVLGVRTFTALSLAGFLAALVADRYSLVAPFTLAAVAVLIVVMYYRASHLGVGITTEIAAIATCGLGMLCHTDARVAGVLAILLTAILASKRFTHETVSKMQRIELTATLKFLAVILIVLPLLPDRALDPYEAFNPHKVGLLVVLISGISFVGYFLTRILGPHRGLGLTGILGGLTSSTAVTASMAAQAKQQPALRPICAFSTLAANATMFIRVLVVVALLDLMLVKRLVWSVGAMALTAIMAALVLWLLATRSSRGQKQGEQQIRLKNPFSIVPALKFGAFFVAILFVAKLAKLYFGDQGLYAAAALSGLADVDAITLSIAEQARNGSLAREIGAIGITIAVVCNSLVKTGIAIYSGGWKYGRIVALCLGLATVVGLGVAFLLPVLS